MTTADLLYSVETKILEDIAELLGRGSVGSAEWKLDRLNRMGVVSNRAMELVAAVTKKVQAGLSADIEQAALADVLKIDARALAASKAGATIPDLLAAVKDPSIRKIIETWQATAKDQANLAMAKLAENAGEVYKDAINKSTASVILGATDGHKALRDTIKEWSENGIPSIIGHRTLADGSVIDVHWTTEAYVNMVERTNMSRVAAATTMQRAEQYGTDLVEVTSHPGSRPSHYEFQGNVYSRSGSNPDYPPLSDTGYGEAAGIMGCNCMHTIQPFWEGVSTPGAGPTQTEEENAAMYEESQKQRGLERSIRSAKRQLALMEKSGDNEGIAEAKTLIKDRQATMREFVSETGRTRRSGREQIYDT